MSSVDPAHRSDRFSILVEQKRVLSTRSDDLSGFEVNVISKFDVVLAGKKLASSFSLQSTVFIS